MKLVCVQDFFPHKRGDYLEVPDGSDVAPQYFALADEDENADEEEEQTPATASPESTGRPEDEDQAEKADDQAEKE